MFLIAIVSPKRYLLMWLSMTQDVLVWFLKIRNECGQVSGFNLVLTRKAPLPN